MENLENIQKKLDTLAAALMLFQDGTLVVINAYGKKILPGILPGASAEDVLGDGAVELRRFSGDGAMLFPVSVSGLTLDAKVSAYDQYTAVELMENADALSASALRSISEGLLSPMATVMALTPKLLPQLEHTGDPANMARAAQLNKGLYMLFRAANHIRQAGMEKDDTMLNKKQVHVRYWLQEFTERLQTLCATAQRQLQVELTDLEVMCDLDQEQMERAIMNLISNAIKFTQKDGIIQFTAVKAGKQKIRITIADNGCGIAPYEMGTLFQRKEHRPQIPDPRCGIGLGLPIARSIVRAHGGTLLVESQEGVGTAVHLSVMTVKGTALPLHSVIQSPSYSGGFNVMLMELADALPNSAFDTRSLDL